MEGEKILGGKGKDECVNKIITYSSGKENLPTFG